MIEKGVFLQFKGVFINILRSSAPIPYYHVHYALNARSQLPHSKIRSGVPDNPWNIEAQQK